MVTLSTSDGVKKMMCPNCGATKSDIGFEVRMSDVQFWECKLCDFEWMVRKAKNITKQKIREEERI